MNRSASPAFSVIIPTYRRADQLKALLDSLLAMDYPKNHFEVIVVDDGSEQPPDSIVASFQDRLDVQLLKQKNMGPGAARNTGVARAKNEFVAFVDDDCLASPDWLQKLGLRFSESSECGIGGKVVNGLPQNSCSASSQLLMDYLYQHYNSNLREARFCTSNNLAFPKNLFQEIGGFNADFQTAEDRELCDRWVHKGNPLIFAPEAIVYHFHDLTFSTFWKQHFGYGKGALHFREARLKRNLNPVPIEPFSFYFGLLEYPFLNSHTSGPLRVSMLMFLSQVANALGFFSEKFRRQAS
jgi:GT2 family glycosyltransferase